MFYRLIYQFLILFLLVSVSFAEIEVPFIGEPDPENIQTNTASTISSPETKPSKAQLKLALELTDGSRVMGAPLIKTVPIITPYAEMDVALKLVSSIEFADDHKTVKIHFQNDDQLEGTIGLNEIELETLFSKCAVEVEHITSVNIYDMTHQAGRGMILYYTFDKDKGGKVIDKSGHNNHGSLQNNPEYIKGLVDKSLKLKGRLATFSSAGDHVLIPYIDLPSMKSFSISLWANAHSFGDGESLISFGEFGNTGKVISILQRPSSSKDVSFRIGSPENCLSVPWEDKDLNRYVFYCMTYKNGIMKAYKDGTLKGEKQGVKPELSSTNSALGRHWWWYSGRTCTSTRLSAELDEVRIYNRALPDQEIKQIYNSQKPR
ncbi:LamG domain-containing protein [Verrucomicrobiota bacterium]